MLNFLCRAKIVSFLFIDADVYDTASSRAQPIRLKQARFGIIWAGKASVAGNNATPLLACDTGSN